MLIKKPRVAAIDLDETVVEFIAPFFEFCHKEIGHRKIKWEDIRVYSAAKLLGIDECMEEALLTAYFRDYQNRPSIPTPGSRATLEAVRGEYDKVIAVTSRSERLQREMSEYEMQKHFPGLVSEIYFTNEHWEGNLEMDKVQLCQSKGARVLLEDSVKNCINASIFGIDSFLVTKPWNERHDEKYFPSKMKRVGNISGVIDYLSRK